MPGVDQLLPELVQGKNDGNGLALVLWIRIAALVAERSWTAIFRKARSTSSSRTPGKITRFSPPSLVEGRRAGVKMNRHFLAVVNFDSAKGDDLGGPAVALVRNQVPRNHVPEGERARVFFLLRRGKPATKKLGLLRDDNCLCGFAHGHARSSIPLQRRTRPGAKYWLWRGLPGLGIGLPVPLDMRLQGWGSATLISTTIPPSISPARLQRTGSRQRPSARPVCSP